MSAILQGYPDGEVAVMVTVRKPDGSFNYSGAATNRLGTSALHPDGGLDEALSYEDLIGLAFREIGAPVKP